MLGMRQTVYFDNNVSKFSYNPILVYFLCNLNKTIKYGFFR